MEQKAPSFSMSVETRDRILVPCTLEHQEIYFCWPFVNDKAKRIFLAKKKNYVLLPLDFPQISFPQFVSQVFRP